MKKMPQKRKYCKVLILVLGLFLLVHFARATAQNFQKMATEFQKSAISDFIGFSIKGERYPLMHTISELRYRVFSEKLGINKKSETRACSLNRTYGVPVPNDQTKFCHEYDQNCFDPSYKSKPLEFFVPMINDFFSRPKFKEPEKLV